MLIGGNSNASILDLKVQCLVLAFSSTDGHVEVSSLAEGGPAAKAGIKQGDVVLEFNGQPVEGTAQFSRLVRETPVGRQVRIKVWRSGAAQTLTAMVGENKQTTDIGSGDGA